MSMLDRAAVQIEATGDLHNAEPSTAPAAAPAFGGPMKKERGIDPTPLAVFVRRRLEELELKQSDFCRLTGFDQGLLSKIQNSVINSLSLESALRLAIGLSVSPRVIFRLTDRMDMQELAMRAYAIDFFPELVEMYGMKMPGPVLEISRMAMCVHSMGRSLSPAHTLLYYLSMSRRGTKEKQVFNEPLAEANGA